VQKFFWELDHWVQRYLKICVGIMTSTLFHLKYTIVVCIIFDVFETYWHISLHSMVQFSNNILHCIPIENTFHSVFLNFWWHNYLLYKVWNTEIYDTYTFFKIKNCSHDKWAILMHIWNLDGVYKISEL
jgi:hypothetical protein